MKLSNSQTCQLSDLSTLGLTPPQTCQLPPVNSRTCQLPPVNSHPSTLGLPPTPTRQLEDLSTLGLPSFETLQLSDFPPVNSPTSQLPPAPLDIHRHICYHLSMG
ncbi:hypothetical protein [Arthrospira platensis]|nr:hypothetical protein SPLC1_S541660 [Arthrospira platensis C1]